MRLKFEAFLLKIGFNEPNFFQNIDNFWAKLLVFGVNMLLHANTKISMITELRK